jgi:predicted membrane metal-binding protein
MEDRTEVQLGSERSLAVVFAAVFLIVGLWPVLKAAEPRHWALGVAALFLLVGFLAPKTLAPLNRLWFRFGMVLHRVVNPVVMGLIFFVTVVPTGLIIRALGRDPLKLKFDRLATSYWTNRDPPGPSADSFKNQF